MKSRYKWTLYKKKKLSLMSWLDGGDEMDVVSVIAKKVPSLKS